MHRRNRRDRSRCESQLPVARSGAVLTALGVLLLTSCAGDSGPIAVETPEDPPTNAPAATHPSNDADPDGAGSDDEDAGHGDGGEAAEVIPTPVEETSELVFEHLSTWDEYPSPSETELLLAFYSGNPACYGVRSVVEEDEAEVRVATISGTLPDAVGSACTQEARYVSVVIELEEPLGERELLPLSEVELAR